MYEELVARLREHGEFLIVSDRMKAPPNVNVRNVFAEDYYQAANAIEELSAKATPKRVGFAGWKGCRDTRYKCPYCKKNVRNDETYCHKCGQALMFPRISFTPYVPGEKQELIVTWPDEPPKEETE